MSSIVVKVGKTSKLMFNSHVKARRALLLREVLGIYERDNDSHVLIIENISPEEEDTASEIITKYKGLNKNNLVFFYVPDNDDVTCGVADELNSDIIIAVDKLYKAILDNTGINVSPFIKDRTATSESDTTLSNDIKDVESDDSDISDAIVSSIKDAEEQEEKIKLAEVESANVNNENNNTSTEQLLEDVDNIDDSLEETKVNIKKAGDEAVDSNRIVENSDIFGDLSDNDSYDSRYEDMEDTEDTPDTTANTATNNTENSSDANNMIISLRQKLADSKYEYSILMKDMQDAHSRIGELEKLVNALKDEKTLMKETYDSIVSTDEILEDPIPLSEYQGIKEQLAEATTKLGENDATISDLREKLADEKDEVAKHLVTIAGLNTDMSKVQADLDAIQATIDSGEIHADVRAQYDKEIAELNSTKADIEKECDELSNKHKQDIATIELLTSNLTLETKYRYSVIKILKDTFLKFKAKVNELQSYRNEANELSNKLDSANTRIEELEQSNNTTTEELNAAKLETLGKDTTISELNKKIAELEQSITEKDSTIESNTEEIDRLSREAKEKDESISSKDIELSNKDVEISSIKTEYADEIAKLNSDHESELEGIKTTHNSEIEQLNTSHSAELEKIKSDNESTIESLKAERDAAVESTKAESATEISNLQQKISSLNETIKNKDDEIASRDKTIQQKEYEVSIQLATIEQRDTEIETLNDDLKTKTEELTRTNEKVEKAEKRLKDTLEKLRVSSGIELSADELLADNNSEEVKKLKDEIESHKKNADKLNNQIDDLNNKIATLEARLEIEENQKKDFEKQLKEVKESSSNTSKSDESEQIESLRSTNQSLTEKLTAAQRDNTLSANEITRLNKEIARIEKERDRYKNAGMTNVSVHSPGHPVVNPLGYNGNASIISVFGSGSFGITSVAISLAYKLSATTKVAYLDLDLMSPRADAWFNKSPAIVGIDGISGKRLQDTSFGILFESGIATVANNIGRIVIQAERTKGGGIDFMSGVYYRPDVYKVAAADYTSLLNILATRYNYIIADLGKLGSSEIQDSLIKEFSNISDTSIVVTTDDRFDIRDTRNKLSICNVDPMKTAWLINSSSTGTIDDKTRNLMGGVAYGILIEDTPIRGKREKLFKNRINSDKFNAFLNNAVFGRR